MNYPKISIVIPVYNVEDYLKQCVDSVINQTYKNIEIILVNDGSSDKSPVICDNYSKLDQRVKVIHKKNEGVSVARNIGIDESTGEFLMFLDSDDWIDLNTCSLAYEVAQRHSADIVMWSYIREFNGNSKKKNIYNEEIIIFDKEEVRKKLHRRMVGIYGKELEMPENADAIVPVWMKLYKTNIIKENKIEFEDLRKIGTSEDALFNLNVFGFVEKAVYINHHLYHYRRDNVISITAGYKPQLYKQWDCLFDEMETYISNNSLDDTYTGALKNRIALSIIGLGFNELKSNNIGPVQIRNIKGIISSPRYKDAYKNLTIKHFPFKWKAFFMFTKINNATGIYFLLKVMNSLRRM